MERYSSLELSVGAFVLLGLAAVAYLGLTLGQVSLRGPEQYAIEARFSSVGSLKAGDPVKLAGVTVGEVEGLALVDYAAVAALKVDRSVVLPSDTIASIHSAGLLGDAYVSLSPGAALSDLKDGDRILKTEPAVSITELIAKYAFGSAVGDDEDSLDAPQDTLDDTLDDALDTALDSHLGTQSGDQGGGATGKPSPFDNPLE